MSDIDVHPQFEDVDMAAATEQAAPSADPRPLQALDAGPSNGEPAHQAQQPAQQMRPPIFPSDLASARNVGTRTGPAWSGPPSIKDIFDRKGK